MVEAGPKGRLMLTHSLGSGFESSSSTCFWHENSFRASSDDAGCFGVLTRTATGDSFVDVMSGGRLFEAS